MARFPEIVNTIAVLLRSFDGCRNLSPIAGFVNLERHAATLPASGRRRLRAVGTLQLSLKWSQRNHAFIEINDGNRGFRPDRQFCYCG